MVGALVGLKARLTWNGFRSDKQRRIGLPVAVILLGWAGIWLARSHYQTMVWLRETDPGALPHYLAWSALLAFLVWVTLPVVIFPLDENLDPQQLGDHQDGQRFGVLPHHVEATRVDLVEQTLGEGPDPGP